MAAGPGISPLVDLGALRSGRNYPHQVAGRLGLALRDVTCSGATTAHVLHSAQRTVTGPRPPQIDAVTEDAALVTITVGGNDIGYIGGLTVGSLVNTAARGVGLVSGRAAGALRGLRTYDVTTEDWTRLHADLVEVLEAIRARASQARIVVVDYLTVIGADWQEGWRSPLSAMQAIHVQATAAGLARTTASAAATTEAHLVAASQASWTHGVGSAEPWVTGFEVGVVPFGGRVPFHPNLAGMSAVADLVVRLLDGALS
jgi:lysophospholipase L1-like esterase